MVAHPHFETPHCVAGLCQVAKDRMEDVQDLARKQLGGRGRDEAELPAHYYEWAATLSDLPPDQRATVLNTLPEDDRLHVQVSRRAGLPRPCTRQGSEQGCSAMPTLLCSWVAAAPSSRAGDRRQNH